MKRTLMKHACCVTVLALLLAAGCDRGERALELPSEPPAPPPHARAAPGATGGLPAGAGRASLPASRAGPRAASLPVAPPSAPGAAAAVADGRLRCDGFSVAVPAEWRVEPAGAMRLAQLRLPGASGDDLEPDAEALLVVSALGGPGADVEANRGRWAAQAGQDDPAQGTVDRFALADGTPVAVFEITGAQGLWVGVVERPEQSYFFKAVGPAATLASWRAALRACVRSFRVEAENGPARASK